MQDQAGTLQSQLRRLGLGHASLQEREREKELNLSFETRNQRYNALIWGVGRSDVEQPSVSIRLASLDDVHSIGYHGSWSCPGHGR